MSKFVCLCHIIERVKWHLFYHLPSIQNVWSHILIWIKSHTMTCWEIHTILTFVTFEFQVFCSYRIGVLVHPMDLLHALQRIWQCSTNEIEFLGIATQTCRAVYREWRILLLNSCSSGNHFTMWSSVRKSLHWLLNVIFCRCWLAMYHIHLVAQPRIRLISSFIKIIPNIIFLIR